MSKYVIENFRPTLMDVELVILSKKAADMPVKSLLRQRTGEEWHAREMPTFKTMDAQVHRDRDWIRHYDDNVADRAVLTIAALELLAELLIGEAAYATYYLEFQVGRRELDDLYHIEFRLSRAMDALKALGSPRWRELADSYEPEIQKAKREAEEYMSKEDAKHASKEKKQ